MAYNKFLIVGAIGSGKTTLARKLSKILKIKNYELDNIAYKRRDIHEKQKPEIRDKKLKSVLKRKKWLLEGFYSRAWTYPIYKKAEIVIILNIKTSLSKKRVIKRYLKRKLSFKKDKKHNEKFKAMIKLLKYVEEYPTKYFKLQKQAAQKFNKNVLILNSKKEIDEFLKKLK